MSTLRTLALMCAAIGVPFELPYAKRHVTKEVTPEDIEHLEAAQRKRERKAKKRTKGP